jgi:hypothetical protein
MSYELKYLKYKNKYLKLKEYLGGTQDELIIPDTVKSIGEKEYLEKGLTKLTIGESVKTIGFGAFYDNKLTTLIIPNSVETIGEMAFFCNKLTTLTIGKSVKTIDDWAFYNNLLSTLIIPNSVKTIGKYAFSYNQLIRLTIGNSVEMIGGFAFCDNKLTELIIPDSVRVIDELAFFKNRLMKLRIPDLVVTIGDEAFRENNLTDLTIGNYVEWIGKRAFRDNKLMELIIPNSVETIGEAAFYKNILTELTIGISVKTIGDYAFSDNQLRTLIIPNSVETIGLSAFYNNQLRILTIGNSVKTIDDYAFSKNELIELKIGRSVETIGLSAFYNNQLRTLTIGNSVKTIDDYAFSKNELIELIIPNSVEMIGDYAFYDNKLTTLTIGESVQIIGTEAFSQNPLTEIITYNREFNNLELINLITTIDKERIIIDELSQIPPYTIKIRDTLNIKHISREHFESLVVPIKFNLDGKINKNFINQLYNNLEFKQLIYSTEKKNLVIISIDQITNPDGSIQEKQSDTIDQGGTTSLMFSNLFDELTKDTDKYFIPNDDLLILNNEILETKTEPEKDKIKDKIKFIGALFAYSLQLDQLIDIKLHPLLLFKMLFGIDAQIDETHINYLIKNFDLDQSKYPFGCFKDLNKPKPCSTFYDEDTATETDVTDQIQAYAIKYINTYSLYNNDIINIFVEAFRSRIRLSNISYDINKNIPLVSTLTELIYGKDKVWSLIELKNNLVFVDVFVDYSGVDVVAIDSAKVEELKNKLFTIIGRVIMEEQIKQHKQPIVDMYERNDDIINEWIQLFIQLLTNKKKLPYHEFKISYESNLKIGINQGTKPNNIPYDIHTCYNQMDIYMSDIENYNDRKPEDSVLYDALKIVYMKEHKDTLGLA